MTKAIHGIPNSGWQSPSWNWGSAVGTGHDCARISRRLHASRSARQALVDNLLAGTKNVPEDFEEVKLALALFLQNARWDGSDGGPGGYGEVLQYMAEAKWYETSGTDDECSVRFIQDMKDRFHLLGPSEQAAEAMACILDESDLDCARRRCCGLVLETMKFVDNGP